MHSVCVCVCVCSRVCDVQHHLLLIPLISQGSQIRGQPQAVILRTKASDGIADDLRG